MKRAWAAGAIAAYAALLAWSAPPWPDDWDGIGFLASIARFDMDAFAPHAPGYPVYVAMLRVAHVVLRAPIAAASAVSIASAIATALLARAAAARAFTPRAGDAVAVAVSIAPLAWRSDSGTGTEALALALAALGVWALVAMHDGAWPRAAPIALGLAVGLGLGVRLSWGPLYAPMLLCAPRGARLRAWGACAAAVAAWAVPLVAVVGSGHLVALVRTQLAGHAERWGGTVVTDPGVRRVAYLARDVFVDGLGLGAGTDPIGIGIGLAALLLAGIGLQEWARARWSGLREAAIVLGPYLLWIALGQNLRQQPRHALPLVAALAAGLAVAGSRGSGRAPSLAIGLAMVIAARTAADAHARRTTPPPGQQVVDFVRRLPDPRAAAVFGQASVRFFEPTELADHVAVIGTVGDALMAMARMNDLPERVFVTSEVAGIADARPPLEKVETFCRPARIDRRMPCLTLYEWRPPVPRR